MPRSDFARRPHGRRAHRSRVLFEAVESRLLLCYLHEVGGVSVTTDADGPILPMGPVATSVTMPSTAPMLSVAESVAAANLTSWSTTPSGLPILNSRLGAPVSIFLDFDGWSGNGFGGQGTFVPFSTDADQTTFNAGEQSDIVTGWDRISTFFAPFDINVTTIQPDTSANFSWSVISNSVSGGYSYLNFYDGPGDTYVPSAFNASGDLVGRTSGLIHEIGHNFGMAHQATYDNLGNMTAEYTSAADPLHGPIMGVDFDGQVKTWLLGHPSGDRPTVLQDDVSLIVNKVKSHEPAGGIGYRVDDFSGAPNASATPLSFTAGQAQVTGVIEQLTDADAFSFTSAGGGYTIGASRDGYSGVDLKVEVYDASGTLVSQSDSAANNQSVNVTLPAGTYYAVVKSHGNYSDLGRYALSVQALPAGWGAQDIGAVGMGGSTAYDPATGTWSIDASGADVWGTSDEFRYTYQALDGDGQIVARVASQENTDGWAKAGVMIRETLGTDAKHAFMLVSPSNGTALQWRSTTGGQSSNNNTAGFAAPYWVRLARSGNTIAGFRSADGVTWTPQGSVTIAMNRQVYVGLAVLGHNEGTLNTTTFTNVSVVGNVNPASVDGSLAGAALTASTGQPGQIGLSWGAVAGADGGYTLLRSVNGGPFGAIASLAAGATTYTDGGLAGNQRYFYQLVALKGDGTGGSMSNTAQALTRPPAVFNARVSSISAPQLTLDWRGGDSSGESGYVIERSTDNASWTQVGTPGQNSISYNDSGLSPGTLYYYRITPSSALGAGASVVVSGMTRLPQVTGLVITGFASNSVSLSWGNVNGESAYWIERSGDGTTWTALTSVAANVTTYTDANVSPLGEYHYRVIATATGGNDSVASAQVFTATPDAAPLPSPWASQDIGAVGGAGAAGYQSSTGTWTVLGAGIDVWGSADEFRFTYQTLDGDGSIVARVATQENTDGWAKSGVMIRETLAANSKHAFMLVSPGNGTALQWRSTTGGASTNNNTTGLAAPYWVRLVRTGNIIAAFRSADGVTWTPQAGAVTIAMNRQVYIGLAVLGSGGDDDLNTTTFTDVAVTTPNAAPTVAVAAAATPSPVTGTTTNLSVLGADDQGESNLTYTWATTALPAGATAPTFGVNGTNAAKNTVATFTQPGNYTFTVTITDAGGRTVTSSVGVTVAITVSNPRYDNQRAISLTFNTDVSATLSPGDLSVQAASGGAPVTPVSVSWDGGTRTATFTCAAPFADGNYTAAHAGAGFTFDFFALAGDANGDRVVNFADLLALARNYNKPAGATWADGDFDGNGMVNFNDLLTLARNYNKALPATGAAAPAAAPAPAALDAATLAAAMSVAAAPAAPVATSTPQAPTPAPAKKLPVAVPKTTPRPVVPAKAAPANAARPTTAASALRDGDKAKAVFSTTRVAPPAPAAAKPKAVAKPKLR